MDSERSNICVRSCWKTLTGLTQEETKDYDWVDAVYAEARDRFLSTVKASLFTAEPIGLQYRVS